MYVPKKKKITINFEAKNVLFLVFLKYNIINSHKTLQSFNNKEFTLVILCVL